MTLHFPAGQDDRIAELAKALGHPARLRILKAAGIITGEIAGPRVCYALSPGVLSELSAFIGTLTPSQGGTCCLPARADTPD